MSNYVQNKVSYFPNFPPKNQVKGKKKFSTNYLWNYLHFLSCCIHFCAVVKLQQPYLQANFASVLTIPY